MNNKIDIMQFIVYNRHILEKYVKEARLFFFCEQKKKQLTGKKRRRKKMVKKLKRAFTITELVIVIAVIAILAAVLIPTFTSLINKANQSSDQSAVRNMNLALQNAEVDGELETLSEALAILEEAGMNAQNYSTLVKNTAFVWVRSINRVLYVNTKDYSVIYPEEYKTMTFDWSEAWPTLEGKIRGNEDWLETEINSDALGKDSEFTYGVFKSGNEVSAIKVDTSARLISAVEYLDKEENKGKVIDLYLGGDIDLEGAEWDPVDHMYGSFYGNDFTIKNLQMSDPTTYSEQLWATSGNPYTLYGFVSIFEGREFRDVTFKNLQIYRPGYTGEYFIKGGTTQADWGNYTVGGAIGAITWSPEDSEKEIIVSNVKIEEGSQIVSYSRVGGIVGLVGGENSSLSVQGKVTIEKCVNKATLISDYEVMGRMGFSTAGGIVAISNQTKSNSYTLTIKNCENYGSITGARVGGIASMLMTNGAWTFENCKNYGDLTVKVLSSGAGENFSAGGIVAVGGQSSSATSTITVTGCLNAGNIRLDGKTEDFGSKVLYVGHMVAEIQKATVKYNKDDQTASTNTYAAGISIPEAVAGKVIITTADGIMEVTA